MTGFCDASGSFTYSRSGRQLALYFAIKLGLADRGLLEHLQSFFGGIGRIYDVGPRASYFRVSRRDELAAIVEHFQSFPLQSSKQRAFEVWREMVSAKQDFRHPDRALLDELAGRLRSLRSDGEP